MQDFCNLQDGIFGQFAPELLSNHGQTVLSALGFFYDGLPLDPSISNQNRYGIQKLLFTQKVVIGVLI